MLVAIQLIRSLLEKVDVGTFAHISIVNDIKLMNSLHCVNLPLVFGAAVASAKMCSAFFARRDPFSGVDDGMPQDDDGAELTIPRYTAILIKYAFVSAYASRLTINGSGATRMPSGDSPSRRAVARLGKCVVHARAGSRESQLFRNNGQPRNVCVYERARVTAGRTHAYAGSMGHVCVCISKNRRACYSDVSSNGD